MNLNIKSIISNYAKSNVVPVNYGGRDMKKFKIEIADKLNCLSVKLDKKYIYADDKFNKLTLVYDYNLNKICDFSDNNHHGYMFYKIRELCFYTWDKTHAGLILIKYPDLQTAVDGWFLGYTYDCAVVVNGEFLDIYRLCDNKLLYSMKFTECVENCEFYDLDNIFSLNDRHYEIIL